MASTDTTQEAVFYRPGLLFLSKYFNLQIPILHPEFFTNPSGEREMTKPMVMAEFGDLSLQGDEFPDAEGVARADIRGGAFDLDERAGYYGWDDATKEAVARKMLLHDRDPAFKDFYLYEPPIPEPPWPNYDNAKPAVVAKLAEELGLVSEALSYERSTLDREAIVSALEEMVESEEEVPSFEEE